MADGLHAVISGDSSGYEAALKRAATATTLFQSNAKKANSSTVELLKTMSDKTTSNFAGGLDNVSSSTSKAATNTKNFKNVAQQAGYQLQDLIVQIQGGTSAFVAFGQQGSQMAGAFGPGGAIIGAVIALASALGGVLFTSLSDTGDKAETTSEKLARLAERMDELRGSANELRLFELNNQMAEQAEVIEKEEAALKKLNDELLALNANKDATVGMYTAAKKAIEDQTVVLLEQKNLYREIVAQWKTSKVELEDGSKTIKNTAVPAIQSYLKNLREEVAVLGMSNVQKAIYTAQTKGATSAQLKEVEALSSKIQAYNDEVLADKERLKAKAALAQAAEAEHQAEMQRLAARASILGASGSEDPQAEIAAEQAKNDLKIAMLQEYLNQEVITQTEFNALKEAEEQRHMDALREIRSAGMNTLEGLVTASYGKQAGLIAGSLSDILSSTSAYSKKAFEAHKVLSLGTAIISGYEAATSAWAQGMRVGGPPVAAAFTAASVAKTAAQIQAIRSQSYGSSSGGSSSTSGTTSGATTSAEAQENRIANVTLVGDTFSRSSVEGLMEQLKEASDMGYKVNFG